MSINSEYDIVNARERGRWFAEEIGFRGSELILLSTLISELARKVLSVNKTGRVVIKSLRRGDRNGIAIDVSEDRMTAQVASFQRKYPVSKDKGSDERLRMLAGKHIADEFEVRPSGDKGAVVKIVKWL